MLKKDRKWENILWILFLGLLVPIFYIGRYNVISADDYAYGLEVHRNWLENHSLLQAIPTAFEVVAKRYVNWQGTYTSVFFMALNPLNFSGKAGWMIPFFMISMLCTSTVFFFSRLVNCVAGNKQNNVVARRVSILYLLVYIQSLVSPVEGFFWYNGAVHYMLMHSFMLFYLGLFLKLQRGDTKKASYWVQMVLLCILGILVGGGNYISALQCVELAVVILAVEVVLRKVRIAQIIGFLPLLLGFAISILAPGNAVRQAGADGMGVVSAVLQSFVRAVQDIKEWVNPLVLILLAFAAPILWQLLKNIHYEFRFPVVAVMVCFCLYASLYAPGLYGVGNVDAGRIRNIIQASFYLYLLLCETYVLGALYHRMKKTDKEWGQDLISIINIIRKYVRGYYVVLLVGFVCVLLLTGDKNTYTSVSALRSLVIGEAKTYYAEMQERLVLYEDENLTIVEVEAFSVRPKVLYFTDVVAEGDANYWINENIAQYYGKEKVVLRENAD